MDFIHDLGRRIVSVTLPMTFLSSGWVLLFIAATPSVWVGQWGHATISMTSNWYFFSCIIDVFKTCPHLRTDVSFRSLVFLYLSFLVPCARLCCPVLSVFQCMIIYRIVCQSIRLLLYSLWHLSPQYVTVTTNLCRLSVSSSSKQLINWLSQGFTFNRAQNGSFWRCSTQPISLLSSEKTKSNTTKANMHL